MYPKTGRTRVVMVQAVNAKGKVFATTPRRKTTVVDRPVIAEQRRQLIKADPALRAPGIKFVLREIEPPVVLVDPDVAEVFTTSESVNRALRALMTALPKHVYGTRTTVN